MLRWDRESSQIDERNGDCLTLEDFATDTCIDKHTLWYRQLMSAMSDVSVADLVPFNGSGQSFKLAKMPARSCLTRAQ